MLILCYGMPKSGSTLAFEVVRGMLRSAGCEQETFINDERDEAELAAGGLGVRNYANLLTIEKIQSMMTATGPNRKICVKNALGASARRIRLAGAIAGQSRNSGDRVLP